MHFKAPANEETFLRKHCFPKCFRGMQTRKHLLRKQKCFWSISETFLLLQQMFPGATNREIFASATMFPHLQAPLTHWLPGVPHWRAKSSGIRQSKIQSLAGLGQFGRQRVKHWLLYFRVHILNFIQAWFILDFHFHFLFVIIFPWSDPWSGPVWSDPIQFPFWSDT